MVFGGTDGYQSLKTLEYLNETDLVTQALSYNRSHHAMVVLPCP
jgi:hypothetical protein